MIHCYYFYYMKEEVKLARLPVRVYSFQNSQGIADKNEKHH